MNISVSLKMIYMMMAVFFLGLGLHTVASAQEKVVNATYPESGLWTTDEKDGVFHIYQCGQDLCGNFVGMKYQGTTPPVSSHGHSQCNFLMLRNFVHQSDGKWIGKIADPRNEKVYDAKIWLKDQNTLNLRGYMGISLFGETKTWHRFNGKIGQSCQISRQ